MIRFWLSPSLPPPSGQHHACRAHPIVEPTVRAIRIRRGCDHRSQWEVQSMKLSAPVYRLKRDARLLARKENIPLHAALDRIAVREGFGAWSLLAAKASATAPAGKLFARLSPGDLVLVGARPGHGKTLLSLELAVEAMKSGHRGAYFTLEETKKTCRVTSARSARTWQSSPRCSSSTAPTPSAPITSSSGWAPRRAVHWWSWIICSSWISGAKIPNCRSRFAR